ncbi:hypothetical protein AVDCRST_MAG92-2119 [uncultured Coleofasciculus sp.]|uniref:Uncharacterized protein n=1 Tax=uncultured Coleofasciculus sp. TaxID=1267456 RepID=A0A6J4IKP8_9CYAN|nr:hypothetical protein AVDCRST_MAG92-2119 [uncultured Coleofasciculus sp.]
MCRDAYFWVLRLGTAESSQVEVLDFEVVDTMSRRFFTGR